MPLEIVGAGWGRTGTTSLCLALSILGYDPCYHPLLAREPTITFETWQSIRVDGFVDWAAVFGPYRASLDWPAAAWWRELAKTYPEAKVLLSVRDPLEWHASVSRTLFMLVEAARRSDDPDIKAKLAFEDELIFDGIFEGRFTDRAFAVSKFEAHVDEVRSTIPPERLIICDTTDGWEPLCEGLGIPRPDQTFPRMNSTDQYLQGLLNPSQAWWNK